MLRRMRGKGSWCRVLLVLCSAWLVSACSARVVNLGSRALAVSLPAGLPFDWSVGVEPLTRRGDSYGDASDWQEGLEGALRKHQVFVDVHYPYSGEEPVDFILRGSVTGKFRSGSGFPNFLTWWPGPLVFAHNWRGTRFVYDTHAELELVDARSRKVVARYDEKAEHQLIHRSTNPGPFFGALIIIPGVVKGIMTTWPRGRYRSMTYEAAYGDFWRQVSMSIARERAPRYADLVRERSARCGEMLDAEPVVGGEWSAFRACQTRRFVAAGQQTAETGTVTLYVSGDRSLEVHVRDGRIARWTIPSKLPAVGTRRR